MLNTQKYSVYYDYSEGKFAILKIKNWDLYDLPENRYFKYPIDLVPSHMKVNDTVLIDRSNYKKEGNIYKTKEQQFFYLDEEGRIVVDWENDYIPSYYAIPEHDKELLALGDAKVADEFHLHTSKIVINKKCDDFIVNHIHFLMGTIQELNNEYALIDIQSLLIQYPKSLLKKKEIKLKMDDYLTIQGEEIILVDNE